jgi:hypothetical protein
MVNVLSLYSFRPEARFKIDEGGHLALIDSQREIQNFLPSIHLL